MHATPLRGARAACPTRRHGRSLLARFGAILALRRQRARLADLDDHMLRDIGLSRAEAATEAARPFWDVPPHWRR
jgi:uncharacterized protein YjiS (DUF1127 family)